MIEFTIEICWDDAEADYVSVINDAIQSAINHGGTVIKVADTPNDWVDITFKVPTKEAGLNVCAECWRVGIGDLSVDWPEELT